MLDTLSSSGMSSIFLYGGIAVAFVVIGGLFFLYRRKASLQSKQDALQKAYSAQTLEQPVVNLENLAAPDEANVPQENSAASSEANLPQENIAASDDKPVEETNEQSETDITAMFRAAGSLPSDDESEEGPESTSDGAGGESKKQPAGQDAMFDLFTAQVDEDSNIGKLAASLDDVDIGDIMGDAQDLVRKLGGRR